MCRTSLRFGKQSHGKSKSYRILNSSKFAECLAKPCWRINPMECCDVSVG